VCTISFFEGIIFGEIFCNPGVAFGGDSLGVAFGGDSLGVTFGDDSPCCFADQFNGVFFFWL
jgi:hypothetical protein